VLAAGAQSVITSIRLAAGTADGVSMDSLTAKFRD
jgi:hypothetical protein